MLESRSQGALAAALAAAALASIVPASAGDFNGDGIDDLAIGAPGRTVMGALDAGAVNVVYGQGLGVGLNVAAPISSYHFQEPLGGVSTAGDRFGHSLAIGDFDADGFDDLAMGAPGDNATGAGPGEGMVIVAYGGPGGLGTGGLPPWVITQVGLVGGAGVAGEFFGFSLAAGDFDADGVDDLAIGVANHDDAALGVDVGSVCVLHGATGIGLTAGSLQYLLHPAVGGGPAPNDHFGVALAAGDFDCNGAGDLAVGADGKTVAMPTEGAVVTLYGLPGLGLDPASAQFWAQGAVGGGAEMNDHFGATLVGGDFDGDGATDLAIGIPFEDIGATADTGMAAVLYGVCGVGLQLAGRQLWHQDRPNVPEANGAGDFFATSLASGDFDGNGCDDLAVGQPGEDRPGGANQSGGVTVLYGNPFAGLGAPAAAPFQAQFWDQNVAGVPEVNAPNDNQGASVAIGDFDADGLMDLAFGVPLEDRPGGVVDGGFVNTVYGTNWAAGLGGLSTAAPVAPEGWHGGLLAGGIGNLDRLGGSAASNR